MRRPRRTWSVVAATLLLSVGLVTTPASAESAPVPIAPLTQAPDVQEMDLASLGLDHVTVQGLSSTVDAYFPVPRGALAPNGHLLRLVMSHSALLSPRLSTLTAMVNGASVGSVFLGAENVERSLLQLAVPAQALVVDRPNHLELRFHLRLGEAECEDPNNPALNARVWSDSALQLSLSGPASRQEPNLEQYPFPFVEPGPLPPSPLALNLPTAPSASTLTAAVRLTASLGQQSAGRPFAPSVRLGSPALGAVNTIVVAPAAELGEAGQVVVDAGFGIQGSTLTDPQGRAVGENQGVLAVAASADKLYRILVVTGTTDTGVLRAADALVSADHRSLLAGRSVVVDEVRPATAPVAVPTGARIPLTELGRDSAQVTGLGSHDVSVTFVAPSVDPNGFGYVDLEYAHSGLLDKRDSAVVVSINAIPVGSISLGGSSGELASKQLRFAGKFLRPGTNTLSVRYSLRVPDVCHRPNDEDVWAVLSGGTTLQLPARTPSATLDLRLLPHPFLDNPSGGQTIVVFPDQIEAEASAAFIAVARLGARAATSVEVLRAVRLAEVGPNPQANLVCVGIDGGSAPWAVPRTLHLDRRDVRLGDLPAPGVASVTMQDGQLGGIELTRHGTVDQPWAALWVSGTDGAGMLAKAAEALGDRDLAGRVAVVDQELRVTTVAQPVLEVRSQGNQVLLFRLLAGGVFLIILGMIAISVLRGGDEQ